MLQEISTEWAKQLTSQCDKFVAIRQTVVDAIKSYSAEMELKLSSNSTPEVSTFAVSSVVCGSHYIGI